MWRYLEGNLGLLIRIELKGKGCLEYINKAVRVTETP